LRRATLLAHTSCTIKAVPCSAGGHLLPLSASQPQLPHSRPLSPACSKPWSPRQLKVLDQINGWVPRAPGGKIHIAARTAAGPAPAWRGLFSLLPSSCTRCPSRNCLLALSFPLQAPGPASLASPASSSSVLPCPPPHPAVLLHPPPSLTSTHLRSPPLASARLLQCRNRDGGGCPREQPVHPGHL